MSSTIWHSRENKRTEGEVKTKNQHKRCKKSAASEEMQQLNRLSWKINFRIINKIFLTPSSKFIDVFYHKLNIKLIYNNFVHESINFFIIVLHNVLYRLFKSLM